MSTLRTAAPHQLFQLTDLLRIVDEYGRPLWVKLPAMKPIMPPLPQFLMESKTWGEVCERVPPGSFGLLNPRPKGSSCSVVFVVLDKPFHAGNGLLNVSFLPLCDRKTDDDFAPGHDFYGSGCLALTHELWIDPSADTTFIPAHPRGERSNDMGMPVDAICIPNLSWRVMFVDPQRYCNTIGGFISFLLIFHAHDFPEWRSSILRELLAQRSDRLQTQ